MAKATVEGKDAVLKKLQEAMARQRKALEAGLYAAGNNVGTQAKETAPHDDGALRGSIYTTLPVRQGARITVEVGAGGPAEDYAVIQHERLDFKHEVGGPKFLERALHSVDILGVAQRVAKAAFESGSGPKGGGLPKTPWSASLRRVKAMVRREQRKYHPRPQPKHGPRRPGKPKQLPKNPWGDR